MRAVVLCVLLLAVSQLVACGGDDDSGQSNGGADAGTGGPDRSSGTFFLDTSNNFVEPSIAVDAKGGVHVAYRAMTGNGAIRYAYCASRCGDPGSWASVEAGDGGAEGAFPSLVLDSAGRPRIAWYRADLLLEQREYWFASCDSNCTEPSSWSSGLAFQTSGYSPTRGGYLAIDPQGGYALVTTGDGTIYARCEGQCAQASSWRQTRILTDGTYDIELAFAGPGRPRFAGSRGDIVYYECDADCESPASWSGGPLFGAGTGLQVSLRLDSQGRPRIALYEGYIGGHPASQKVFYTWCDSSCAVKESWGQAQLPVLDGFAEEGLAFALDSQNRPRIAGGISSIAESVYAAGLAWCDEGCESTSASWESGAVESAEELDAASPVPLESGCSISLWSEVGRNPSLALDPWGQPRLAYEAAHGQGGTCYAHEDVVQVRVAVVSGS